jgi:hypothetical protein
MPCLYLPGNVIRFRNYFAGTGWLPEIELRIMNKYLAGLFKNISTAEFRIRKSSCCTSSMGGGDRDSVQEGFVLKVSIVLAVSRRFSHDP